MADPLIGKSVDNGEYRIIERIGSGGMGAVYKAEQPSMNRFVAIKVLHTRFLTRGDVVSRFRREARAMSQLSHPNTARVYKYGQLDDGSMYFVMEYLEGRNAVQQVKAVGPIDPETSINVMIQVCGALDEAHQAGIIHRDLKPENVFLTNQAGREFFPKVLDFGLAKVTEKQMGSMSMLNLTQSGAVFGTPEFMSPEQAMGNELDRRSDIYSLGMILYEMLTGMLPFEAKSKREMMHAQVKSPPMPLAKRAPSINFPRGLEEVIQKALAKNPDDRYQTAVHFADGLRSCLPGSMTSAAKWAMPPELSAKVQKPETGSPIVEADPPQLPMSRTPYVVLAIGIALSVAGAIAIAVTLLGN
jgi:serine/threonine-protein kinase